MDRLKESLTVESTVLAELVGELRSEGLDDYANRLATALDELDDARLDPLAQIKRMIMRLRPIDYALESAKSPLFSGLRESRRRLAVEADRFLGTPGRHSSGEYPTMTPKKS